MSNTLKEDVDLAKKKVKLIQQWGCPSQEDIAPVLAAEKVSDDLWEWDGYVNPDELRIALNKLNEAIEDLCLKIGLTEDEIDDRLFGERSQD